MASGNAEYGNTINNAISVNKLCLWIVSSIPRLNFLRGDVAYRFHSFKIHLERIFLFYGIYSTGSRPVDFNRSTDYLIPSIFFSFDQFHTETKKERRNFHLISLFLESLLTLGRRGGRTRKELSLERCNNKDTDLSRRLRDGKNAKRSLLKVLFHSGNA